MSDTDHQRAAFAKAHTSAWTADLPTHPGWYWFAEDAMVPWAGTDGFHVEMVFIFLHEDLHFLCVVHGAQCRPGVGRRPAMPLEIYQHCGYWSELLQSPDLTPIRLATVDEAVPGATP